MLSEYNQSVQESAYSLHDKAQNLCFPCKSIICWQHNCGTENVSPTALMKQLGWQSLENRRYHQRMTMVYNISHGLVAVPPTELTREATEFH